MLKLLNSLFNNNNKKIKQYKKIVNKINAFKDHISKFSDTELQKEFNRIKSTIQENENKEKELNNQLPYIFALIKDASSRVLKMEHYDVQLIGGLCLHDGVIAEMKTGEGKTLVATLPAITNSILGLVHIVTVNDYLAQRDCELMKPLFDFLGVTSGFINSKVDPIDRPDIYSNDIVYTTNDDLAFDYLRDNMVSTYEMIMQKEHSFVIVDEVDSVLIDEARNPLIISGESELNVDEYILANKMALKLIEGKEVINEIGQVEESTNDFIVKEKEQTVLLTDAGIEKIQLAYDVENIFELEHVKIFHNINQALTALYIKHIDIDYIIRDNEVKIIDQSTGRISEGVRYSEGLHQALEAKENCEIKAETNTMASITYQNFFRIYKKLSGMTGTAMTESTEFWEIYKLDVVSIPTNLPITRKDITDKIYINENAKFKAIAKKVKELKKIGQPVLLGTASIEQSEKLSKYLDNESIEHTILNAKNHFKEAEIIESAGELGSVTVATNMAGRGVDIKLANGVLELGGLYVIGTERHESRRIDNQLRGRSGRQGDAGTTGFYLSVEDKLMRIFGGDTLPKLMAKLGINDEDVIESSIVARAIEKSQSKVEQYNYEQRKQLLDYDDVINEQRKVVYKLRHTLLKDTSIIPDKIKDYKYFMLENFILHYSNEEKEKLLKDFNDKFNIEIPFKLIEGLYSKEIVDKLSNTLDNALEYRLSALSEKQLLSIFRSFILEELDKSWLNHINDVDTLKMGIGLRSYNQKDPLIEFKKESYHMFLNMIDEIKINIVNTIYNISSKVND